VASRRVPAVAVVFASQLISAAIALGLALVRREPFPAGSDLALAAGAGVATSLALVAFYHGLATARVGVVAPVAAVLGAGIPVVAGVAFIGPPGALQLAGMALGLVAVGLVSRTPGADGAGRPTGFAIAVVAGIGFGSFFLLLGLLEGEAVFFPLLIARLVAAATIALAGRAGGVHPVPPRSILPLAGLVGALDMAGMAGYVLATQVGRLDEAAVLSSMYPVVTIVLAALVFHERIGRVQALGIVISMTAIALIGAG